MTYHEAEDLLDWLENHLMIGDGLKQPQEQPRYPDMEEMMVGRCMSCKSVIRCPRREVRRQGQGIGVWSDLLGAECPKCGATVFVMAVEKFLTVSGGLA